MTDTYAGLDDGRILAFMAALHSNVPEADRPMSRSDYSDEQWQRIQLAFASLASSSATLEADAARLRWFAENCMRDATVRVGMEFQACKAWGIAASKPDLRAAIDAARAAMPGGVLPAEGTVVSTTSAASLSAAHGAPPPGWRWVQVESKSFDDLLSVLDRADRKGYMPDAMHDEWDAFKYLEAGGKHG